MIPDRAEPAASRLALSPEEFRRLSDLLYERAGLYFGDGKRFLLESRVYDRIKALGVRSGAEYLALLTGTGGAREWTELLDVVTTHETSFFRNRPQLEAFQRKVLPGVLRAQGDRGRRRLRIWSAACATGEEPYTLAMMILELLGDRAASWDVRILGTDLVPSVLDRAREGVYPRHSFRTTPAYFVQKYFRAEGPDAFRLGTAPRRLVELRLVNFADDAAMARCRGFHVIFCRNALIYFDREAKRRFVAHFARALEAGGYLFVGHSESLHGISDDFKLIHFPGALAYRKPPPETHGS